MVEFALILPLLLFILVVAIDFSRFGFALVTVSNAARAAAMHCVYIPVDSCNSENSTVIGSINNAVQQEGGGYIQLGSIGSGDVVIIYPNETIPYLEVQVSYLFETIFSWPGIPDSTVIQRKAKTPAGLGAP